MYDAEAEGFEEEVEESASKTIQVGKGSYGPNHKKCRPSKKKVVPPPEVCELEPVVLNFEKGCLTHSFCVVENLKRKGIYPVQPKGLPWATGRLLYLPGQRPEHYDKTQDEIMAMEKKKKKKLDKKKKALELKNKRLMNKLRHGDHVKLCDVMSTTQEIVLLMKVITMVMERKQAQRRKILAEMQTDYLETPEEGEEEYEPFKIPEEIEGEEEIEEEINPE